MLFHYRFVPHQMDKMQSFVDFIFHEVWSKAAANGAFGLHLFNTDAELREVMESFSGSSSEGAKFFYRRVERIYELFAALPPGDIEQLERWYEGNNDLERVCANDP